MKDKREADKFCNMRICDMTSEDRDIYHDAIGKRAAFNALRALGLNDPETVANIAYLNSTMRSFRSAKKLFWAQVMKVAIALGTAAVLGYFLGAQKAAKIINILSSN